MDFESSITIGIFPAFCFSFYQDTHLKFQPLIIDNRLWSKWLWVIRVVCLSSTLFWVSQKESVLNYVPYVLTCLTCLLFACLASPHFLPALRAFLFYVLYVSSFFKSLPFSTGLRCLYVFTCLHFFTCFQFLTCLMRLQDFIICQTTDK